MKVRKTNGVSTPILKFTPVKITPIAAAVATALGSISGVSIAQEVASATGSAEQITVTASRREANLQELPYSVSALSEADLQALQITDLDGIARYTPGLTQTGLGARSGGRLIIRGINNSNITAGEFLNNTGGSRVATYYGETPVYIDLKLIDTTRVEVLRGPQGTLYGASSLSGAVRYIPNAPDLENFSIEAHARGYDTDESSDLSYDMDAVINMPLIEDTLALRAMLGYADEAGWIDYKYTVPNPGVSCPEPGYNPGVDADNGGCDTDGFKNSKDANDLETTSAGLSLLWQISDVLDAQLSWRYQDQKSGGRNANSRNALGLIEQNRGIDLDAGKYISGLRVTEPNDRENNIYNLEVNWNLGFANFLSSTSYTTYDEDGRRDQTDLLLQLEPDDYYYYEEFPAFAAFTNDGRDDDFFTQEFRLVSNDDDSRLDWMVGAFYQDSDLEGTSQEISPNYWEFAQAINPDFPTGVDTNYDSRFTQDIKEKALYGELGFDFTDDFTARIGARWFDFDDDVKSCAAFPLLGAAFPDFYAADLSDPAACTDASIPSSADSDDVIWKLGADYTFTDDLLGYALYSEGYSSGVANPRRVCDDDNDTGCVSENDLYADPEETKNYELGLKSQWLDGRLTVNGAVFYIDWENTQVQGRTETAGFLIVRDGGEAKSYGLELEAVAQLTDNWVLDAGYTYVKAELSDGCTAAEASAGIENCAIPDAETKSGDRLPGSPENQGYARLMYNTMLSNGLGFNFEYGLTAQSDVFTKIGDGDDCCRDNGEELGGYALHFLSAGLSGDTRSGDRWDASLFVENLFNKYAVTGVRDDRTQLVTLGDAPDFTARRYFQNTIKPRTIGVDLRYRFE